LAGKDNLTSNIIVIALLGIIAIGAFTVPRFNYSKLVDRQARVETEFLSVKGEAEAKSREIEALHVIVSKPVEDLIASFSSVSEKLSNLSERLSLLEQANNALRLESATELTTEDLDNLPAQEQLLTRFQRDYTSPITLPDDLRRKIHEKLPFPNPLSKLEFPQFLATLQDAGILASQIPDTLQEEIATVRQLFLVHLGLLNSQKQIRIAQLIDQANETGNFTEVAMNASSEEVRDKLHEKRPGLTHVRAYPSLGVKRYFVFPFDEYRDWMRFDEMELNVRDHLLRDIALLVGVPIR